MAMPVERGDTRRVGLISQIMSFLCCCHGHVFRNPRGSLMSRRSEACRRAARRTAPVVVVVSSRARPKSVRQSNKHFAISA